MSTDNHFESVARLDRAIQDLNRVQHHLEALDILDGLVLELSNIKHWVQTGRDLGQEAYRELSEKGHCERRELDRFVGARSFGRDRNHRTSTGESVSIISAIQGPETQILFGDEPFAPDVGYVRLDYEPASDADDGLWCRPVFRPDRLTLSYVVDFQDVLPEKKPDVCHAIDKVRRVRGVVSIQHGQDAARLWFPCGLNWGIRVSEYKVVLELIEYKRITSEDL